MTDNRTTELLPCPFCGGEAEFQMFDNVCNVVCSNCHIGTRFESLDFHEQVVEAWNTRAELGSGMLTAEQAMAIAGKHQPDYCSDTHVCFDWQAIADELNAATLGGGTCHDKGYIEDGEWYFGCSNCGGEFDYSDFACEFAKGCLLGSPKFCPNCGAKVVKR